MRPSGLPEFRAQVVKEFSTLNAEILEAEHPNPEMDAVLKKRAEATRKMRELMYGPPVVLSRWQMAELFFVTREMAEVAEQAAKSMPAFELHREDLPAEIGLVYFETVTHQGFDVAVVWGPAQPLGLAMHCYCLKLEPGKDLLRVFEIRAKYGEEELEMIPSEYGKQMTEKDRDDIANFAQIVRCTWLLMQQKIASVTNVYPDRHAVRRARRANIQLTATRVIELRRHEGGGDALSREYLHRWVVRGHWRNQWYPSQERHIPIWISPHIKGPDEAPLLGGEKVYAWKR